MNASASVAGTDFHHQRAAALEALALPALGLLDLPERPPQPASLIEALVERGVPRRVVARALEENLA